jgi:hypothetical protein
VSSVKHGSSAHNGLRPLTLAVGRGQACARSTLVLARDHRADFVCWPECSRGCLCRLPSITRFLVVGQTYLLTFHEVMACTCDSIALIAAIIALPCTSYSHIRPRHVPQLSPSPTTTKSRRRFQIPLPFFLITSRDLGFPSIPAHEATVH